MKFLLCSILLACTAWITTAQEPQSCRLGFSYEFSNNKNWGKDKPVIMKVYPNSPAEKAGLKQNDIIERINGARIEEISPDDVDSLISDPEVREVRLTIHNFSSNNREVTLEKECTSALSLGEEQLATAFSMYSVESTHDRLFICPFMTKTTDAAVDFSQFTTFDFTDTDDHTISKIESVINNVLKTELSKKGLRQQSIKPDFTIQTYYKFNKNPNFKKKSRETAEQSPTFRYDITRDRVTKFPFYDANTPESEAEYILQFGIRFIDQRYVRGRVLWECEANELMSSPYAIDEYASIHIPLMCMQFPYVKYERNAQFILTKKSHNYTGIRYSIYELNKVVDVDYGSPASKAGIQRGDIIDRINGKRMDHTADEFTAAYRQFITNTLKYRDSGTRFTNANGFPNCMFWDKFKYPQIAKIFETDKYMTAFSYLYFFAPYVNPEGTGANVCILHLRRGTEKLEYIIRPELRSEKTIELN